MSYAIFTDACSNLPGSVLNGRQIRTLPAGYTIGDKHITYLGDIDTFDAKSHYDLLREGVSVSTSLINAQQFLDHFRTALNQGLDIVYIGLSSGISGTYQASCMAAEELREEFPERTIRCVDSLGAGFGPGLLSIRAADLRDAGKTADEAAQVLEQDVKRLCQFFTVDDLMYLRRTGRLHSASAVAGTLLGIKPILFGNDDGHIVTYHKCRGRKKAVEMLAKLYAERVVEPENQVIAISHGDCEEEALALAEKIKAIAAPKELILCPHEPFTGSHVGPGMLGVFFFSDKR